MVGQYEKQMQEAVTITSREVFAIAKRAVELPAELALPEPAQVPTVSAMPAESTGSQQEAEKENRGQLSAEDAAEEARSQVQGHSIFHDAEM